MTKPRTEKWDKSKDRFPTGKWEKKRSDSGKRRKRNPNTQKNEGTMMSKVKSIFDDFPSLFSIKRDAIDEYPLWRDEQSPLYYRYVGQRIMNEFIEWRKMAEPYLRSCENKAYQYDEIRTKTIICAEEEKK